LPKIGKPHYQKPFRQLFGNLFLFFRQRKQKKPINLSELFQQYFEDACEGRGQSEEGPQWVLYAWQTIKYPEKRRHPGRANTVASE